MKTVKKYIPQSCGDCKYHGIEGLFDFCIEADGMLLCDDDTDYEKERDKHCPLEVVDEK